MFSLESINPLEAMHRITRDTLTLYVNRASVRYDRVRVATLENKKGKKKN